MSVEGDQDLNFHDLDPCLCIMSRAVVLLTECSRKSLSIINVKKLLCCFASNTYMYLPISATH